MTDKVIPQIEFPEYSEWYCCLFGGNEKDIVWRPLKGQHPNCFWRFMQYICFGNRWRKDEGKETKI